jgi:site-specific DNA-methyltransferase (adenine-specific)
MIKWTVETRKLSELKAYEQNPRRITEKGLNDLIKSLELFGLAEPIVINRDDTIIGGHARVQALKRIKGKAVKVEVYVPDRLLDDKEVQELCVRLNKNVAGAFDFDMLANQFDARDLVAWGFNEEELGIGEPEAEETGAGGPTGETDDEIEIIKCPNCKHDFSVVELRKKKKKK